MKKSYMKPTLRVVKIQQHRIICTSPNKQSLQMRGGIGNQIDDEEYVW